MVRTCRLRRVLRWITHTYAYLHTLTYTYIHLHTLTYTYMRILMHTYIHLHTLNPGNKTGPAFHTPRPPYDAPAQPGRFPYRTTYAETSLKRDGRHNWSDGAGRRLLIWERPTGPLLSDRFEHSARPFRPACLAWPNPSSVGPCVKPAPKFSLSLPETHHSLQ
jgi:hypothetical protein